MPVSPGSDPAPVDKAATALAVIVGLVSRFFRGLLRDPVAVCAIVISVASLGLAMNQGRVAERTLRAEVLPLLHFDTGNTSDTGEQMIYLALENRGVGPARLETLEIAYGGRPLRNWVELMAACCVDEMGATFEDRMNALATLPPERHIRSRSVDTKPQVLAPGDEIEFLGLPLTESGFEVWKRLNDARWQIDLRACYCSVLDECWELRTDRDLPQPVASCTVTGRTLYRYERRAAGMAPFLRDPPPP